MGVTDWPEREEVLRRRDMDTAEGVREGGPPWLDMVEFVAVEAERRFWPTIWV